LGELTHTYDKIPISADEMSHFAKGSTSDSEIQVEFPMLADFIPLFPANKVFDKIISYFA
jgi:hypothetical protein